MAMSVSLEEDDQEAEMQLPRNGGNFVTHHIRVCPKQIISYEKFN